MTISFMYSVAKLASGEATPTQPHVELLLRDAISHSMWKLGTVEPACKLEALVMNGKLVRDQRRTSRLA
jgi:hypothetical protein